MHQLVGSYDGVDRTSLDAQGAADAMGFVYVGYKELFEGRAARSIYRFRRPPQQGSQRSDAGITARRASVNGRRTLGHGLCIGATPVEAALRTLRLRQKGVDTISE